MSEIEINEDNCVLNDMELVLTCIIFEPRKRVKINFKNKETKEMLDKIFQKIKKLNDMAKELRKNELEAKETLKRMEAEFKDEDPIAHQRYVKLYKEKGK